MDSNQRKLTLADLQSAPFSHSGIYPFRLLRGGCMGMVNGSDKRNFIVRSFSPPHHDQDGTIRLPEPEISSLDDVNPQEEIGGSVHDHTGPEALAPDAKQVGETAINESCCVVQGTVRNDK